MQPSLSLALVVSEAVWVETELEVSSIRFARYENDSWEQVGAPLYTSESSLTSPALGTNSKGHKLLIWTEQKKAKTILMFMTAKPTSAGDLVWSSAEIYSKHGIENFAASIVYDNNDTAWVFWSSTTETYSDIVMQHSNDDVWGSPIQVHSVNNVPDDRPRVRLTEDDLIRVEWTSFDLESGASVFRSKEFSPDSHGSKQNVAQLVDDVEANDISLPDFISPYAPALLHFPTNGLLQSTPLSSVR